MNVDLELEVKDIMIFVRKKPIKDIEIYLMRQNENRKQLHNQKLKDIPKYIVGIKHNKGKNKWLKQSTYS